MKLYTTLNEFKKSKIINESIKLENNYIDIKKLEEFIKLYVIKDYKNSDKVEIEIDNEFSYDNNDEYIKV